MVTNTYPRMGASYSSNPCDHWAKKPGRRRLWPRIQNRTDGGGQGCPYHPFSARDYVCPGFANPVDRRNTARSKVMKFITFLCQYEGRDAYYRRAVPAVDILKVQGHEAGCTLFMKKSEGTDLVNSATSFEAVLSQLNNEKPHDTGDINGIRCSEIVAISEGSRNTVDILLRDGTTLTRSDNTVKEYIELWRANG